MDEMPPPIVRQGLGWVRSVVWSVFLTVVAVLVLASLRGGPLPTTVAPPL